MRQPIRIALAFALLLPPTARADVILAQSLFTSSQEGWLLADFYLKTVLPDQSGLFWQGSGGNPGGFIGTTKDALAPSSVEAFLAPSTFLGDQSAAFGGTLSFSMQALLGTDVADYPVLAISDGSLFLQFRTSLPAPTWTQYSIPLTAGAGWEVASGVSNFGNPGSLATDAQIMQVLAHLSYMSILEDVRSGDDRTNLDNVILSTRTATTAAPEPGSLSLLAGGVFLIAVTARSRSRTGKA